MHYIDALALRPERERNTVNGRLGRLARRRSRRAGRLTGLVTATQNERRIEIDVWNEFFDLILATPMRTLERDIRLWAWNRRPAGVGAKYTLPLVRATTRSSFINGLQDQARKKKVVLPAVVAAKIADDMVDPVEWTTARRQLALMRMNLSAFVVWATFDPANRPYADLAGLTADEVACDLGLDDARSATETYRRRGSLLLTAYDPSPETVHIPTMVEAWGSDPPNFYFVSAPPDSRHGETRPWRTPPRGHIPRRRPEVVHAPSPASGLRSHSLEVAP
jgi:hypothetical protein